jgi:hypothetical protein
MNTPNNIFSIAKKYINSYNDYNSYLQNIILYSQEHDIKITDKYKLTQKIKRKYKNTNNDVQFGGDSFKTTIGEFIYEIDYYKTKENNKRFIFIDSKSVEGNCITLSYESKDILNIVAINSLSKCYLSTEKLDLDNKNGTIMMNIIINFAKKYKFKSIILDDRSTYYCETEKKKIMYNLSYVHTLSSGEPWYYKFGFRYISSHQRVEYNKKILNQLHLIDFPLEFFMKIIMNNVIQTSKYSYFEDKETINDLYRFVDLYCLNKDKSLMDFFSVVSKNSCIIMSLLANDIFDKLNLKHYVDTKMILNII